MQAGRRKDCEQAMEGDAQGRLCKQISHSAVHVVRRFSCLCAVLCAERKGQWFLFMKKQRGRLHECEHICPCTWVGLCAPTEEEVAAVCTQLHVDVDLVRAAHDEEERSRIDFEDGHMLILVDTPTVEVRPRRGLCTLHCRTASFSLGEHRDGEPEGTTALTRAFSDSPVKNFSTKKTAPHDAANALPQRHAVSVLPRGG